MDSISQEVFEQIEEKIRQGKHLRISGPLEKEENEFKTVYYNKNGTWLLKNREGYFVNSELMRLFKRGR